MDKLKGKRIRGWLGSVPLLGFYNCDDFVVAKVFLASLLGQEDRNLSSYAYAISLFLQFNL